MVLKKDIRFYLEDEEQNSWSVIFLEAEKILPDRIKIDGDCELSEANLNELLKFVKNKGEIL